MPLCTGNHATLSLARSAWRWSTSCGNSGARCRSAGTDSSAALGCRRGVGQMADIAPPCHTLVERNTSIHRRNKQGADCAAKRDPRPSPSFTPWRRMLRTTWRAIAARPYCGAKFAPVAATTDASVSKATERAAHPTRPLRCSSDTCKTCSSTSASKLPYASSSAPIRRPCHSATSPPPPTARPARSAI